MATLFKENIMETTISSPKTTVFRRGIPTEADVEKLRSAFPSGALAVGDLIPYADIEETLGVTRAQSRFYTVVRAWRSSVEKVDSIIFGTVNGVGLRVLSENGKVQQAADHMKAATRQALRCMSVLSHVNTAALSADHKAAYDKLRFNAANVTALGHASRPKELPTL